MWQSIRITSTVLISYIAGSFSFILNWCNLGILLEYYNHHHPTRLKHVVYHYQGTALILLLLATNLSYELLRCWIWNVPFLESETFRLRRLSRTKEPRCLFQMDIPCNMTAIQRSAHYTITFSKKPNNSCVIDNGGHNQILCACSQEDYCSSHCGYIVEIWKKSKAYKEGSEPAKCMMAYERACLNKEIQVGAAGDYIHEHIESDYDDMKNETLEEHN